MTAPPPAITRRALLATAAALPVAGCTHGRPAESRSWAAPPPRPPPGLGGAPAAPGTPSASRAAASPTVTAQAVHPELVRLENRFDAILGVYALAIGTGATITHRADERFAFCSTFKGLAAAAVLDRNPLSSLDSTKVRYTRADLMASSTAFTRQNVAVGMTLRDACRQAILHSDGTAGNLLLRELGGPKELTAYLRRLDDTVSRVDRMEPALADDTPGSLRDTTTPRAIGTDYRRIVLGDALPADERAFLVDLLTSTRTGSGRIRAGLPPGWRLAHKTGTGAEYGTCNDIGIVWPAKSDPLVLAIMSRKTRRADVTEALLAEATRYAVAALAG